jgi:hypothetical protein
MKERFFRKYTLNKRGKRIARSVFGLVLCFLPQGGLFSLPPQKVLHPGDWAYDALAILSREQRRVFLADSRITVAQMERFLAEIDSASLSESGLVIYDRLAAYLASETWLGFQSDAVSGGLDLILQPELYYKTNESVSWIYDGHSRKAIIQAPLGFSLGPWITAEMDLYFGENEYAATLHDNYVNIPMDPVSQADIHFPKRAYMSAGIPVGKAPGINFSIGLGDNFFGKTRTGSIIISEYLERTIYGQATIYSPALKYTAQVLQYEVNKYHYMHYLQVRPHKAISISLAEGVMVNAPLELRFLNPFTIFHSYESFKTYSNYNEDLGHKPNEAGVDELWDKNPDGSDKYDRTYDPNNHSRIGSYFGVKLEFQPMRYLRFYGLFVMDQFNLPMKKTHWLDTLYPDAAAFQAGVEFSFPTAKGYWEFGFEGVYTYPYMYVMWDKSWSFYKEVPELDPGPPLRYWTGSRFGPDTVAGAFWAGFRSSTFWNVGLSLEFSARGERSELSVFDRDNSINDTYRPNHSVYDVTASPTGIPLFTYTASFLYECQLRESIRFAVLPGYRFAFNAGHEEGRTEHGFEFTLSMRFKFPYNK